MNREELDKKLEENRQIKIKERLAFENKLDNALGLSKNKDLGKILSEEGEVPHVGIWYYLWLKPDWKLWPYPYINRARGHYEVWPALSEIVSNHFHLLPNESSVLQEQYRCFPRGRIDKIGDKWYICHGGDFPKDENGEINTIISRFNLTIPKIRGLVEIKIDDHEKTDPKHVNIAKMLIGNY